MSYKRGWIAVFLLSLAMINYVDRATLSFAIGPISKEFHLDAVEKGYLFSSFLWTYTLLLIPMGLLVDRFGSKKVAGWGLAIWSAATVLTGLSTTIASLLTSRLLMGGGEASSNPAGGKVIREWIPAGERGIISAAFNSGSYAGPALCSLVAGGIIEAWGWRVLFFCAGGLGLVWLLAWVLIFDKPETARWLGESERKKILAERNAHVKGADTASRPVGLLRLMGTKTLWGLALTQGCAVYSQYLFLTWLPSYLEATRHLSLPKTGVYTSVPYAAAVVLCIGMGKISDRLLARSGVSSGRRRNIIAISLVIAAVILVAPFIDSVWALLVLVTLTLTGIATTTSQNYALLNDLLPNPKDIGRAMGFLIVGGNVFGMMAPVVTGYVISITGSYNWAFGIAGLLLMSGAAAILTLTRKPMAIDVDQSAAPTVMPS